MTAPDAKKRPSFTQAEIDLVRNALRNMGVRRDLDDATAKALLDVAEHLGDYDPARPFAPWLLGFARLTAKETRRKERVRTRGARPSPATSRPWRLAPRGRIPGRTSSRAGSSRSSSGSSTRSPSPRPWSWCSTSGWA